MERADSEFPSLKPRGLCLRPQQTRLALVRAAAALWLPAVLPFVIGPLRECGHCVRNYLCLVPVLPGFLAAAGCRDHVLLSCAVSALATLLVLAFVAALIHLAGRRWPWVAIVIGLLSGVQAVAIGHLLRM